MNYMKAAIEILAELAFFLVAIVAFEAISEAIGNKFGRWYKHVFIIVFMGLCIFFLIVYYAQKEAP